MTKSAEAKNCRSAALARAGFGRMDPKIELSRKKIAQRKHKLYDLGQKVLEARGARAEFEAAYMWECASFELQYYSQERATIVKERQGSVPLFWSNSNRSVLDRIPCNCDRQ
jgi:hypothetical protein